jgi:hypothetical protein
MSLATKQQTALLAVIGGCLLRMRDDNLFSVVKMKDLVASTYKQTLLTMHDWPEDDSAEKTILWVNSRIDAWGIFLEKVCLDIKLTVFTCICERCLTDMQSQLNNKFKLRMLSTLEEPLGAMHSFMDPEGLNFPAYEKANELMDELYRLIEWRWVK